MEKSLMCSISVYINKDWLKKTKSISMKMEQSICWHNNIYVFIYKQLQYPVNIHNICT